MAKPAGFGKPAPRVFRGGFYHFYLEGSKMVATQMKKKLLALGKHVRVVPSGRGKFSVYADGEFRFIEGGLRFRRRKTRR